MSDEDSHSESEFYYPEEERTGQKLFKNRKVKTL